MKLLFDFLPIVLFFGVFKYAESHKDWAAAFASEHLGFMVSGSMVGAQEAPVLLATVVVVLGTLAQVAITLARGKKVDTILWATLAIVVVLGGMTVWFHSETFIKWKPTVLNWAMAAGFLVSQFVFGKNPLRALMGSQISLPDAAWVRMTWAWVAFLTLVGFLNLYVAYQFSTDTWVNFKLFGLTGLMLVFFVGLGIYITRQAEDEPAAGDESPAPKQP
jgi:intracellular septation protein